MTEPAAASPLEMAIAILDAEAATAKREFNYYDLPDSPGGWFRAGMANQASRLARLVAALREGPAGTPGAKETP